MIRMDVFLTIETALGSLESSTFCQLTARGVRARYMGLCSPHKSHQWVSFEPVLDGPLDGILLENEKYALRIGDHSKIESWDTKGIEPKYPTEWVGGMVPVALIPPEIFKRAKRHGHNGYLHGQTVPVYVLRRKLERFKEAGSPVFEEWLESKEPDLQSAIRTYLSQSDVATHIAQIGPVDD